MNTDRTADVIVVGAGILGASAAYNLAAGGHRVVVLERGAANREGSGTTAGNLHIQAIHTRRPGQEIAANNRRFLPLQRAASEIWDDIEVELDASVELRRHGGFMIAETPEQEAELHRKHAMEDEIGVLTEIVTGDEARRELPLLSDRVVAADWCELDGYANPLLITSAYLTAARRHGARIHAFSPVTSIARHDRTYTVTSGHEHWTAPVVVDVAGPRIAEVTALAGITLEMSPVAIQMHVTVRIPPVMRHLVQHVGEGLSIKQVSAGHLLIGGGWPAADLDLDGRSRPSVSSLAGNLWQACRILPFIQDLRLLRMWSGPLAATPDEMPVIGEVPESPGFFVAGGTYAFTLGPLWGRTLRAVVERANPPLPIDDLGPGRLVTSRSVACTEFTSTP